MGTQSDEDAGIQAVRTWGAVGHRAVRTPGIPGRRGGMLSFEPWHIPPGT